MIGAFPSFIWSLHVWTAIIILIIASLLIAGGLTLLFRRQDKIYAFGILFALGFLGMYCGFMIGNSRDPVVGLVIPAILTFLGSAFVLLTGKLTREAIGFGSTCIFCLVINLTVGTFWGSENRSAFEARASSMQYKLNELIEKEAVERAFLEYKREADAQKK